jgi:hypothetical protein
VVQPSQLALRCWSDLPRRFGSRPRNNTLLPRRLSDLRSPRTCSAQILSRKGVSVHEKSSDGVTRSDFHRDGFVSPTFVFHARPARSGAALLRPRVGLRRGQSRLLAWGSSLCGRIAPNGAHHASFRASRAPPCSKPCVHTFVQFSPWPSVDLLGPMFDWRNRGQAPCRPTVP